MCIYANAYIVICRDRTFIHYPEKIYTNACASSSSEMNNIVSYGNPNCYLIFFFFLGEELINPFLNYLTLLVEKFIK